jgi:hypothetical protein
MTMLLLFYFGSLAIGGAITILFDLEKEQHGSGKKPLSRPVLVPDRDKCDFPGSFHRAAS